jgi:exodeoxyribonuclease VII small subunit
MTAPARPKKERTFEEAMARLEEIVAELEGEESGLDRQFALFQEGMDLARFCDKKLTEVEKSVEIVLKESTEDWATAPFEPGSGMASGSGIDRPADEDGEDRD